MGDITREDLKIILLFALHMARVDEVFDVSEKKLLARFVELAHLSEEERTGLADAGRSLSHGLDSLSSDAARDLLVKTLCAIASADGLMHSSEQAFMDKVEGVVGGTQQLPPFEQWESMEGEVLAILGNLD